MLDLLVNIDVDDLGKGVAFYTQALGLRVGRRLGDGAVELLGASSRIYLLEKPAGSVPFEGAAATRAYARHWTPVHFDLIVTDLDAALTRARAAGAVQEGPIGEHAWGRIAVCSDPFGHGFCLIAFSELGYDALTQGAGEATKRVLVVAHTPSANTRRMLDAILRGARHPEAPSVATRHIAPLEARPEDVLAADAVVLLTPENLGSMSGAMKDFFDRVYYPCLDRTDGLPYALVIRGRHDGTGTQRGVQTIMNGLKWKAVGAPLFCVGELQDAHIAACEELGAKIAVGLEADIF
jgi:predicted enzyme related to lactoylglutathione lyase